MIAENRNNDRLGLGLEEMPASVEIHPEPDLTAAERAASDLLRALGEDPSREGMVGTPRRMAKALAEMMKGRSADIGGILSRRFKQERGQVVILRDIGFSSLCEHHLLPFIGHAHVAYLPSADEVVGLSKLARVVEAFARRPQIQERMTNQIADAIQEHLRPEGVAVIVRGEHFCMKMRGVNKSGSIMQTMALHGRFRDEPDLRSEILSLLTGGFM
ncbi:MAG: GTP cyclohydrolase I FolE [Phycisphaeraceae bacterium]